MKIYLAAGEDSGDLHGAYLAAALKEIIPDVGLAGMAGPAMRAQGVAAVVSAESHNVVGLIEICGKLTQFRQDLKTLTRAMAADGARALVAIDYGGFNARLVAAAKRAGLQTFYYIPPKLWAWGGGRGRRLAGDLDLVLAVFPFEEEYWRRAGARVAFVGHPLLDITRPRPGAAERAGVKPGEKYLLVMPGSRRQEVAALWPPIARALPAIIKAEPALKAVVAPGPARDTAALAAWAPVPDGVIVTAEAAVDLMPAAAAAIAASGTATLELLIVGTPMVVLYKAHTLTWELGRRLVYVSHLGLPNILAGRAVVPELLQSDVTPACITRETLRVLADAALRNEMKHVFDGIRTSLAADGGGGESAPARAARMITEALA